MYIQASFKWNMERHIDGQQAHKKMFNIANYSRNANENYNEVSPHRDGQSEWHRYKVYT